MPAKDVEYSRDLKPEEVQVLSQFADQLDVATHCTAPIWVVALDHRGRRHLQLRSRFEMAHGFVELSLDEAKGLDDERLKKIIVGRERPCRHPYQGL